MDATPYVEHYQQIEAGQFGEVPALVRAINEWNEGDTQRLLAAIRDLFFVRPDIAAAKQAEAEALFEEWGRNGYQEPEMSSKERASWDCAIGVQFTDDPGSHGIFLRPQDLIQYRLELHFLSLLLELKDEGDEMTPAEARHKEILEAIKAGFDTKLDKLEDKIDTLSLDMRGVATKMDNVAVKSDLTPIETNIATLKEAGRHVATKFWVLSLGLPTLGGVIFLLIRALLLNK